jgi:hypothetical protein
LVQKALFRAQKNNNCPFSSEVLLRTLPEMVALAEENEGGRAPLFSGDDANRRREDISITWLLQACLRADLWPCHLTVPILAASIPSYLQVPTGHEELESAPHPVHA